VGGSFVPVDRYGLQPARLDFPPPPPTGNTPAACLPNGLTVQSIAYVQSFSAQDGSTTVTRLLSANASHRQRHGSRAGWPDSAGRLHAFSGRPANARSRLQRRGCAADGFPEPSWQRSIMTQPAASQQLGCVTDSATFWQVGPVAPGQLLSLFGNGLWSADWGIGNRPRPDYGADVTGERANHVRRSSRAAALCLLEPDQRAGAFRGDTESVDGDDGFDSSGCGRRLRTGGHAMFAVTPSSPSLFLDLSMMR